MFLSKRCTSYGLAQLGPTPQSVRQKAPARFNPAPESRHNPAAPRSALRARNVSFDRSQKKSRLLSASVSALIRSTIACEAACPGHDRRRVLLVRFPARSPTIWRMSSPGIPEVMTTPNACQLLGYAFIGHAGIPPRPPSNTQRYGTTCASLRILHVHIPLLIA